jgi:hypothetical protein
MEAWNAVPLSTILNAFLITSVVLCAIVGFTVGGIIGVRFPVPILSGVLSFPVDCRWPLCWMACGVAVGWNRGWTRKLRRQRPLTGHRFGAACFFCLLAHRRNYQLEEVVTASYRRLEPLNLIRRLAIKAGSEY